MKKILLCFMFVVPLLISANGRTFDAQSILLGSKASNLKLDTATYKAILKLNFPDTNIKEIKMEQEALVHFRKSTLRLLESSVGLYDIPAIKYSTDSFSLTIKPKGRVFVDWDYIGPEDGPSSLKMDAHVEILEVAFYKSGVDEAALKFELKNVDLDGTTRLRFWYRDRGLERVPPLTFSTKLPEKTGNEEFDKRLAGKTVNGTLTVSDIKVQ